MWGLHLCLLIMRKKVLTLNLNFKDNPTGKCQHLPVNLEAWEQIALWFLVKCSLPGLSTNSWDSVLLTLTFIPALSQHRTSCIAQGFARNPGSCECQACLSMILSIGAFGLVFCAEIMVYARLIICRLRSVSCATTLRRAER